jgi:hypothetical protein
MVDLELKSIEQTAANGVFIKLWLDVKHSTLNHYFDVWLIETEVFQMPQLHKHLNVGCYIGT